MALEEDKEVYEMMLALLKQSRPTTSGDADSSSEDEEAEPLPPPQVALDAEDLEDIVPSGRGKRKRLAAE